MTTLAPDRVEKRTAGRTLRGFTELAMAATGAPGDPPWLTELRRAALARFNEVGLPGSKDEEWRFTPLQSLASVPFVARRPGPSLDAADLEPTEDQLRITLAPLSSPHRSRVLEALCTALNETHTKFPGTELEIHYSVATAPESPKIRLAR